VNGEPVDVDLPLDTPLLWVLRDELRLTGTKYGCGVAQCGTCTVLFNGQAFRSCQLPLSSLEDATIVTIEGVADNDEMRLLQEAWVEHQVAQCGYCQSGQIMQATWLLQQNPDPSPADIDRAMSGNLCRCGTYPRIRTAILSAARQLPET
jgi:isoquinoline 1-oxidoreductase alpha subunit